MELVIVLVVLGVLATLAYPKFSENTFAKASYFEQVQTALRYAQRYAVSTGCAVQVEVNAGSNTVSLTRRAYSGTADDSACGPAGQAFTIPLQRPGQGEDYTVAEQAGVDVTAGITLYFDPQGVPRSSADGSLAGGTVTISGRSLTIESATGYVH